MTPEQLVTLIGAIGSATVLILGAIGTLIVQLRGVKKDVADVQATTASHDVPLAHVVATSDLHTAQLADVQEKVASPIVVPMPPRDPETRTRASDQN